MAEQKAKSRSEHTLELARNANETAIAALVHAQANTFMIGTMIAVMRDFAILSPDGVKNVFIGTAAVIDRQYEREFDETARQCLSASRDAVRELAAAFQIEIPTTDQVALPKKH